MSKFPIPQPYNAIISISILLIIILYTFSGFFLPVKYQVWFAKDSQILSNIIDKSGQYFTIIQQEKPNEKKLQHIIHPAFDVDLDINKNQNIVELYGKIKSVELSQYDDENTLDSLKGKCLLYEVTHEKQVLYYCLTFKATSNEHKIRYVIVYTKYKPQGEIRSIADNAIKFIHTSTTEQISRKFIKIIDKYNSKWKSFLEKDHIPYIKAYPEIYLNEPPVTFNLVQAYFGDILAEEQISGFFNLKNKPVMALIYEVFDSSYRGVIIILVVKDKGSYHSFSVLQTYLLPIIVPRSFIYDIIPTTKQDNISRDVILQFERQVILNDLPSL